MPEGGREEIHPCDEKISRRFLFRKTQKKCSHTVFYAAWEHFLFYKTGGQLQHGLRVQTGIKAVQRIAHAVLLPAYRLELPVLDLVRALADGQLAAALQFLFLVARLVVGGTKR